MVEMFRVLNNIGSELNNIITDANTLYAVYLIAFFFGIWVMVNVGLQNKKLKQFNGKPGKVIATMIAIIVTGSIFYGEHGRSPRQLLDLFNNFGGFLFILALALVFAGSSLYIYFKVYRENKKIGKNAAMLYLSVGVYIAAALLLPIFDKTGYVGSRTDAFEIFHNALLLILDISLIVMVIFFFKFLFDILGNGTASNPSHNEQKTKEVKEREKEIKNIKDLLRSINSDLKETNTHFNNKINLLNELRRQIGNYRIRGGNN